jgi:rhodanese-related sulfurtransferase
MSNAMKPDELRERSDGLKLFDIRKNPDDRQIPGSVRVEGQALETGDDLPFGKDEEVVLYCGSGNSCSRIAKALRDGGFTRSRSRVATAPGSTPDSLRKNASKCLSPGDRHFTVAGRAMPSHTPNVLNGRFYIRRTAGASAASLLPPQAILNSQSCPA